MLCFSSAKSFCMAGVLGSVIFVHSYVNLGLFQTHFYSSF